MSETATASTQSAKSPKHVKPPRVRAGKTSIDQASFYMLRLYRTNLEIRFRSIDEAALQNDNQRKIYASVGQMLKSPLTCERGNDWDDIYKTERLLALLLTGPELRQEIRQRLHELSSENPGEADSLRPEYDALVKTAGDADGAASDGVLRAFLLRVLEAIHWSMRKKYLARPIRKEATKNILYCLLVAFILLIVPYVYLNIDFNGEPPTTSIVLASAGHATDGASIPAPSATHHEGLSKWWSMFALWTALTAGLLGAFFSRLITVQRQWASMTLEDVFLHRELSYSLLRAGVGVCGALIVYFFLQSGIVDGALFPKFSEIAIQWVPPPDGALPMTFVSPSKALALLTFWCFLAGFSEALVPSILSNAERQLGDAATARKTS